ncbi:MAG: hypothetical protein NTW29_14235 [Bacteroidetes bacterium]|nr:hypothetical protein [Bacteroidota bacterium]
MGTMKALIEFLRLRRRYEEYEKQRKPEETVLTLRYLDDSNLYYTPDREEFYTDKYKRIYYILEGYNATSIFVWENSEEKTFLVKDRQGVYHNLPDNTVVRPRKNELMEFPIEGATTDYIYDTLRKQVVLFIQTLPPVKVFSDTLVYEAYSKYLAEVKNGTYDYVLKLPVDLSDGFWIKDIEEFLKEYPESNSNVTVKKSIKPGAIDLIPIMEVDLGTSNFKLKYAYYKKGFQPTIALRDEDCALVLKFDWWGSLLSFLNETLFSQGLDFGDNNGRSRKRFETQFTEQVIRVFERKVRSNVYLYYREAMKALFYIPVNIGRHISNDVLWKLIEYGIRYSKLNDTFTLLEGELFVKLIEIIIEKKEQPSKYIERLSQVMTDKSEFNNTTYRKGSTILESLYHRLDGSNFVKFLDLTKAAWKNSRFVIPSVSQNPEFKSSDGPLFLSYKSDKFLGLYFSNAKVTFKNKTDEESLLHVAYETGEKHSVLAPNITGEKEEEIIEYYWYHPFHPVYLKNIEQQDTKLKLERIVPAFLLKANRDQQFNSNISTSIEYGIDAITTFSGLGNLTKFRYLTNVVKRVRTISFVSKAGRTAVGIKRAVRGVAAFVEISSGTINALLKISNMRDTKAGQEISEFLFWMEILSMSGELTVAIHEGLKKSAKKIIDNENVIIRELDKLDNIDNELKISFFDDLKKIINDYIDAKSTLGIVPSLSNAAEIKLYKEIKRIFFSTYGNILKREYVSTSKILLEWKKLKIMKPLAKSDIEELLEIRSRYFGVNAYENIAKLEVEISVNGERKVLQYKAISGASNDIKGFSQTPDIGYMAKQLNSTSKEIRKLFNAKSADSKRLINRFSDTEHKIFANFDDDMQKLFAIYGKSDVRVHSFNFKSLYSPCNSCKKQVLIRKNIYKPEKITFEAVQAKNGKFVETAKGLNEFLKTY